MNRLLAAEPSASHSSVSGAQIAETVTEAKIVIVLMGAATAAAGGMLRDVLCGEVPLILKGRHSSDGALAGAASTRLSRRRVGQRPRRPA